MDEMKTLYNLMGKFSDSLDEKQKSELALILTAITQKAGSTTDYAAQSGMLKGLIMALADKLVPGYKTVIIKNDQPRLWINPIED